MAGVDWGLGRYERTAVQFEPVAEVVVSAAAPAEGERVVDVGCGTGNAALLAAARGATVTGVDPAARLLEVARQRAADHAPQGTATFVQGTAEELPLADTCIDVALSVFGVIFTPDPEAAAAELARVTAPGGRILLSAWIPGGAVSRMVRAWREAAAAALGTPPGPPPFAWHEGDALEGLFGPHGREVELTEHALSFTGTSPGAYFDAEAEAHPLSVAGHQVLDDDARAALRERSLAILEAGNEDPDAFRVTSRYVVATIS